MKRSDLERIDHDPRALLVHAVNSQLIQILFGDFGGGGCLENLLIDKRLWIINVLYTHGIYTHGGLDIAPILKTSSTLHKGTLYDFRSVRGGDVLSIDETVPLEISVSGRCVLSGRPIWLGKTELLLRRNGFGEKYYRRFSLVDVDTAGYAVAKAEIVFPISDLRVNSVSTMGVLNLELFGDNPFDSDAYIAEVPRESINELLSELLHVHAGFLKVGIDMLNMQPSGVASHGKDDLAQRKMWESVEHIVKLHRWALELFIEEHKDEVDYLAGNLEELASHFGIRNV